MEDVIFFVIQNQINQ